MKGCSEAETRTDQNQAVPRAIGNQRDHDERDHSEDVSRAHAAHTLDHEGRGTGFPPAEPDIHHYGRLSQEERTSKDNQLTDARVVP